MKRAIGIAPFAVALALWAQAPPEGGAAKGKGKGGEAAKGKGKAAAETKAPSPPHVPQVMRLVRPNTYLVTGRGTNATFRITPQGVILVNTKLGSPGEYERLRGYIEGLTMQPLKFVINTSADPEASGNNGKFQAAGAEIVSSERTLTLGGADARVIRVGERTVVYFPKERLICLGGVAKTDPAVQALDWTLAIPGSGEPVYR